MGKQGIDFMNSAPLKRLQRNGCDDHVSQQDSTNLSARITSMGSFKYWRGNLLFSQPYILLHLRVGIKHQVWLPDLVYMANNCIILHVLITLMHLPTLFFRRLVIINVGCFILLLTDISECVTKAVPPFWVQITTFALISIFPSSICLASFLSRVQNQVQVWDKSFHIWKATSTKV